MEMNPDNFLATVPLLQGMLEKAFRYESVSYEPHSHFTTCKAKTVGLRIKIYLSYQDAFKYTLHCSALV